MRMLRVVMLTVCYAKCRYAECRGTQFRKFHRFLKEFPQIFLFNIEQQVCLLAFPTNIRPIWKGHARDKQFSKSQTFVNYGRKMFYNIAPRGLYSKTLQNPNLWEIGIFRSKLTSSGLLAWANKPTSLLWMESVHYEFLKFLWCRPQRLYF
jgi:hypothetical protein